MGLGSKAGKTGCVWLEGRPEKTGPERLCSRELAGASQPPLDVRVVAGGRLALESLPGVVRGGVGRLGWAQAWEATSATP